MDLEKKRIGMAVSMKKRMICRKLFRNLARDWNTSCRLISTFRFPPNSFLKFNINWNRVKLLPFFQERLGRLELNLRRHLFGK